MFVVVHQNRDFSRQGRSLSHWISSDLNILHRLPEQIHPDDTGMSLDFLRIVFTVDGGESPRGGR